VDYVVILLSTALTTGLLVAERDSDATDDRDP
jgi:hypothetical protein